MSKHLPGYLFLIVLCMAGTPKNAAAFSLRQQAIKQTKDNYLVLGFGDVRSTVLNELMHELHTYESKISQAFYDENTRQLTIYYTDQIAMDDILQIVNRYVTDYTKLAGTEIQ